MRGQVIGVPVQPLGGERDHGARTVVGDPARDGLPHLVRGRPLQGPVGEIEALRPGRAEGPAGRLQLPGANRGQVVSGGQRRIGDLPELASGQREQADVQARLRARCQRPAGQERLVVGMGEHGEHTAAGHDAAAPRRATVSAYSAS